MAVVVGEVTTEPAAAKSRGAESEAGGGGGEGGEQPTEHDIERMVAMQACRHERVRAY